MKILAFGASSSKNSINKKFATFASSFFKNGDVDILDLNDYELPIFSVDKEVEIGHPELAKKFVSNISNADLIIISFAEHNGTYSTAFKNIFDWATRINGKLFQEKPVILLATSPGARGGIGVLDAAKTRLPFHGANIIGSFSLPEFNKNFEENKGIINIELNNNFEKMMDNIVEQYD